MRNTLNSLWNIYNSSDLYEQYKNAIEILGQEELTFENLKSVYEILNTLKDKCHDKCLTDYEYYFSNYSDYCEFINEDVIKDLMTLKVLMSLKES